MTIEGTALLDRPTVCSAGLLTVRLLDVHRIDAPSICVADAVVRTSVPQAIEAIDFAIEVDGELPTKHRYQLSAHLDLDGDGVVGRGDLVTMEAHPWHPEQQGRALVRLRRVN